MVGTRPWWEGNQQHYIVNRRQLVVNYALHCRVLETGRKGRCRGKGRFACSAP